MSACSFMPDAHLSYAGIRVAARDLRLAQGGVSRLLLSRGRLGLSQDGWNWGTVPSVFLVDMTAIYM